MTNNVDLPWYTSLWRLKECHLLLFCCCLLFVVLNNDLMIFICRRHGFSDEPLLLRRLPWYCGLHQQHARGHCRLAVRMCTARRRRRRCRSINENRRTAYGVEATAQVRRRSTSTHQIIQTAKNKSPMMDHSNENPWPHDDIVVVYCQKNVKCKCKAQQKRKVYEFMSV